MKYATFVLLAPVLFAGCGSSEPETAAPVVVTNPVVTATPVGIVPNSANPANPAAPASGVVTMATPHTLNISESEGRFFLQNGELVKKYSPSLEKMITACTSANPSPFEIGKSLEEIMQYRTDYNAIRTAAPAGFAAIDAVYVKSLDGMVLGIQSFQSAINSGTLNSGNRSLYYDPIGDNVEALAKAMQDTDDYIKAQRTPIPQ